jgi:hypothetical protein
MAVLAACTTAVSIFDDIDVRIAVESVSSVFYGMVDSFTSMAKRFS